MDSYKCMEHGCKPHCPCPPVPDYTPKPFCANIMCEAWQNQKFRKVFWTGYHLQMTLMSIPVCGEIGLEMHPDTDQYIRIEGGQAIVKMGKCKEHLNLQHHLCTGDAVFVPAGTWHNIRNIGRCPLKISSVYAPPHHPWNAVQATKEDAQQQEE